MNTTEDKILLDEDDLTKVQNDCDNCDSSGYIPEDKEGGNKECPECSSDGGVDDDDDLFGGYCPECDCDDLEQIDGTMEYQELECSNNHKFVVENKGWTITK